MGGDHGARRARGGAEARAALLAGLQQRAASLSELRVAARNARDGDTLQRLFCLSPFWPALLRAVGGAPKLCCVDFRACINTSQEECMLAPICQVGTVW